MGACTHLKRNMASSIVSQSLFLRRLYRYGVGTGMDDDEDVPMFKQIGNACKLIALLVSVGNLC